MKADIFDEFKIISSWRRGEERNINFQCSRFLCFASQRARYLCISKPDAPHTVETILDTGGEEN